MEQNENDAKVPVTAHDVAKQRPSHSANFDVVSSDLKNTKESVEDLRVRFLNLISDQTVSWREVAELFITHEASLRKLRAASGVVLRLSAWDDATRSDVFAEAASTIVQAFERMRDLKYIDGEGSFDSWLYSVWKNAVLNAYRKVRRNPRLHLATLEHLEQNAWPEIISESQKYLPTYEDALEAIAGLPSGNTRDVMLDWAAGLNGAESARNRGVSEAWVSQLRKKGLQLVRHQLGITPPKEEE